MTARRRRRRRATVARDVRVVRPLPIPAAVRFRRALDDRFGRRPGPWLRPLAPELLRRQRPLHVLPRIHVDVHLAVRRRLSTQQGPAGAPTAPATYAGASLPLPLAVHAVRLAGPSTSMRLRHASPSRPEPEVAPAAVLPPPSPLTMVLARPPAAPAPVPSAPAPTASGEWTSDALLTRPITGRHAIGPDGVLTRGDVGYLTDRVIAALDRRVLAARERIRD